MASLSSSNGITNGIARHLNGLSRDRNHAINEHLSLQDGADVSSCKNILQLPADILREILTHIDQEADQIVNVDRRGYLSQESFRAPEPPTHDQLRDVGNFRLTCRLFGEIGAKHQFIRVTIRFREGDFERLRGIASVGYLAENVRKFSYMVPSGFYHQKGQRDVRPPPHLPDVDLEPYIQRQRVHRHILENEIDQIALKEAFRAFRNLQHVQLIKLQDINDDNFEYLRDNYQEIEDWIQPDWASACVYGTKSIAEALLISGSPCTRFSSPHLNSNSALILANNPPGQGLGMVGSLDNLASRLTCLELHFDWDYMFNRSDRLHTLPFGPIFSHARNLEALHVGFPDPITVRLEDIFHSIKWDKLVAFGIQGWSLTSDEIIEIARRHKEKLRGLRLRFVYLKDGSRWSDVLHYLRNEMKQLEWVSLRGIGYQSQLMDDNVIRMEVPDDRDAASDSDNDDTSDDDTDEAQSSIGSDDDSNDARFDDDELAQVDDAASDSGERIRMDFPPHLQLVKSPARCNCRFSRSISLEDAEEELKEDGKVITPQTRRRWEKWVVKECPEHGHE